METAAHPSAHSSVLAEDDIYRDLPGSDMAGGIAAPPGFLQAQFDPAERTYRSLPCSTFGEGSVEADGAEYMGMGMEFGFGGAADMRPGADFGASEGATKERGQRRAGRARSFQLPRRYFSARVLGVLPSFRDHPAAAPPDVLAHMSY